MPAGSTRSFFLTNVVHTCDRICTLTRFNNLVCDAWYSCIQRLLASNGRCKQLFVSQPASVATHHSTWDVYVTAGLPVGQNPYQKLDR
eukprot:7416055-Pyramimonas_sp.AAC.2